MTERVRRSNTKTVGVIPRALDSDSPHPSRRHCERSEAIHLSQQLPEGRWIATAASRPRNDVYHGYCPGADSVCEFVVVVVVVPGAPGTSEGGAMSGGVGAVVVCCVVVETVCGGGGPPQAASNAKPLITAACKA